MIHHAVGCKIQPIDRDYNRHGGGRKVHLEFYRPGIINTILAGERSLVCVMESEETDVKIVCERRYDEGIRFFKDGVCGTIRTIDGGGVNK